MKRFFSQRTIRGFFLPMAGAILSVAAALIYQFSLNGSNYYLVGGFLLPLIGACLYFLLLFFPLTERYSSLALELLVFLGFLFFLSKVPLYLSTIFYNGISIEGFQAISPGYYAVFFLEIIAIVFANFGLYISPKANTKEEASHE